MLKGSIFIIEIILEQLCCYSIRFRREILQLCFGNLDVANWKERKYVVNACCMEGV